MKNNPVVKVLKVIVMALLTTLWMFLRMIGRFLMGFLLGLANSHNDVPRVGTRDYEIYKSKGGWGSY